MKKYKNMSLTARNNLKGLYFLIPFYLGIIFFYAKPILQSIIFSFSDVKVGLSGYSTKFCGIENYHYVLRTDESFVTLLMQDILNLLWKTPVIIILSLCLALLINKKFKGRLFVRAVFFLPVIISTRFVLDLIKGDVVVNDMINVTSSLANSGSSQASGITEILVQAGISQKIVGFISNIVDSFFQLIWNSGIQMIIFLSALQGVPGTLYEAASVEGASGWEMFCKITVPMLSSSIFLNIIYTIVDSYSGTSNGAFKLITNSIALNRFGTASSMAWIYFLCISIIFIIILAVAKKKKG